MTGLKDMSANIQFTALDEILEDIVKDYSKRHSLMNEDLSGALEDLMDHVHKNVKLTDQLVAKIAKKHKVKPNELKGALGED